MTPIAPKLLVDTDAFTKLGAVNLLDSAIQALGVTLHDCARLPALPRMLQRGQLATKLGTAVCERLLPLASQWATAPAASTQAIDRFAAIPGIDPGEAQLFAFASESPCRLLTGDKRALRSLAKLPELAALLSGRIIVLESVLDLLCVSMGGSAVIEAIQPQCALDVMFQTCFSGGDPRVGLASYVEATLREVAPLVLWRPS